jgi:hypothetical protein
MLGVDVEAARNILCCEKATKTWLTAGLLEKVDYLIMSFGLVILFIIKRYSILNSGHEFDYKIACGILIVEYFIKTTLIIKFETGYSAIF